MDQTGYIHIYYGDGKGKTTAAMGLAVRAAGAGCPVLVFQFMKDNKSSERAVLEQIPGIFLVEGKPEEKFSHQMTQAEKAERCSFYQRKFREVCEQAINEKVKVLILDEVIYTIQAGLLEEGLLLEFLNRKPDGLEVVLTGNSPSQELLKSADYVSYIQKVKHPYEKGIPARIGIEK